MSMRTMLFSSSNRVFASVFASWVLPTPVGPRNKKEPIGRFGSEMPARERRMASLTRRTASSCPTTFSCRMSSMCSSFSRSPSMILATGMPVHLPTTLAISSSVTLSRSRLDCCASSASFSSFSSSALSCGSLPYLSSAALLRSYSRSARSISPPTCSISSRSFCTLVMAAFSLSHWAFIELNCSRSWASSLVTVSSRSLESLSSSFFSAAWAISCWMILRFNSSSSIGIESISVRIIAQASSTRSMALSGKNRSEI